MNLRNLTYFIELSRSESFGQAAKKLGISKSTLLYAIDKLESELDAVLVNRTRNGFTLTEDGEALLEPAKRAVASMESLSNCLERGKTKTIKVAVPRRCDPWAAFAFIRAFKDSQAVPCHIEMVQETYVRLKESLRTGRADFAICNKRAGVELGDEVDTCFISPSITYCIAGENTPLASAESLSMSDLLPYAITPLDGVQQQHLSQYKAMSGLDLNITKPAMHRMSVALSAAMGDCVALDYLAWGRMFPGIINVPVCLGVSAADKFLSAESVVFRLNDDYAALQEGTLAWEFWQFAKDWDAKRDKSS